MKVLLCLIEKLEKESVSGDKVDSIFFKLNGQLRAWNRVPSVYGVGEIVLEFLHSSQSLLAELNQVPWYGYPLLKVFKGCKGHPKYSKVTRANFDEFALFSRIFVELSPRFRTNFCNTPAKVRRFFDENSKRHSKFRSDFSKKRNINDFLPKGKQTFTRVEFV